MSFPPGPSGPSGQQPFPPGPRRSPSGPRHRIRLVVFAAIALLVFVAIGLVIETALGPKPKQNLTPPTPIPVPTGSGVRAPGHSAHPGAAAALTGPIQIIQGSQLVNGVYLGFPHTTQGAVSAAEEFMTQIGSTLDPDRASAVLRLTADPSYPSGPQDFAARHDQRTQGPGPARPPASCHRVPPPSSTRSSTRSGTSPPDQVTVLLLADDVLTLPGQGTQTRVGVYPLRMHWTEDDWKILQPAKGATYSDLSAVPVLHRRWAVPSPLMSDCKYSSATRSTGSIGRGLSRGQSNRAVRPASMTTARAASPTNQRRRDDRVCDSPEGTKTEADGVPAGDEGACGSGVSSRSAG